MSSPLRSRQQAARIRILRLRPWTVPAASA